jgi:prepilin-type processing-associated H-X9-DG protein
VFHCPKGFDQLQGSPTYGQPVQLSYAVNGVVGGPLGLPLVNITNGNGTSQVMFVWEHCRSPICATNGTTPAGLPFGLPWPLDDSDWINHYPEPRHMGVFNVQFCDGHVIALTRDDVTTAMYYIQ